MRRLSDYDEYRQSKPKNKPLSQGLESRHLRDPGYVTQEEFLEMQESLTTQLKEQTTVLEQVLMELKQVKLHLASLSDADVDEDAVDS